MKKIMLAIGSVVLAAIAVLVAAVLVFAVLNRFGIMAPGLMSYGMPRGTRALPFEFGPLGFFVRFVPWALLLGILVLAIVSVLSSTGTSREVPPASPSPLDIIKERYARGEISKEQFESMKKDLVSNKVAT